VIGLDDDGAGGPQALLDELGGESQIGAESEAGAAVMKDKTDGVGRVVRDRKGLDRDVAHGKLRAGEEQAKLLRAPLVRGTLNGIGGKGVAVNRGVKLIAEDVEPAGVINVLVGDENGADGAGINGSRCQPRANLACAEPAVDKESGRGGLDERTISGASRAEDGHSQHEANECARG